MIAFKCCRSVALCAAAFGLVLQARAETELTVTLRSDDLLAAEGAAVAGAPGRAVASRSPEQENRARLTQELREAGLLPRVSTSAVLRVEALLSSLGAGEPLSLRDASSSVAMAVRLAPRATLELRAFPFDTDYLRLGYLHALDWGGTDVAARQSVFLSQQGGVPGALTSLELGPARLFAAAKWAQMPEIGGIARRFGVLAGARLEPAAAWRFDVGLGYFQRPALEPSQRSSEPFEGASVRAIWRRGVAEPALALEPFRRPSLSQEALGLAPAEEQGRALALEATLLVERSPLLASARATRLVPAPAAALYGSTRRGGLQLHGALLWRSLRFVLRHERGVLQVASPRALEHAELRAWVGGSLTLERLALTPGVELDLALPAALETARTGGISQVFVVSDAGLTPLPPGAGRQPALSARVSLRFQASRSLALSVLGDYQRDPNLTRVASDGSRAFAGPDRASVLGGAQARF